MNENISYFSEFFIKFLNEEYFNAVWLPTFPIKNEYSNVKPTQKLILFLKVFTVAKTLENVKNKEFLRKVFLALCTEKNEEIRKLAAEALINMKEQENTIKDYIRGLAKDESFRETIMQTKTTASRAIVSLCASRIFSKGSTTAAALQYISTFPDNSLLLELLPIKLSPQFSYFVFEIPSHLAISFLQNLRKILAYAFTVINEPDQATGFLIGLYETSKDKNREITNKTISCLNILLKKYTCSQILIDRLVFLLTPAFLTFSYDVRPKLIDLLNTLIQYYPFLRTNPSIIEPCIALLSNPKAEPKHLQKAIECLDILPIETTETLVKSLTQAFSVLSLNPILYSVLSKLTPSNFLSELCIKLIPLCVKKPEAKELLLIWLPFCEPRPIKELTELVLRFEETIPLLALCLENPDKDILTRLGATRKKGLNTEKCFDVQLEALQEISDTLFFYPKAILNALSHFLISSELAFRTTAGKAMLSFVKSEGIENMLAHCIKKAYDEEQVRSILNVWNKIDSPLSSEDPDRSIILNLGHLQIHRRVRALGSLSEASTSLIKKLVIPLFTFYLLYSSSKKNYQPSFIHSLILALGEQTSKLA